MKLVENYIVRTILVLMIPIILLISCEDDDTTSPPPPTILEIEVKADADSLEIANANIVLYDATSGETISRSFSGTDGIAKFDGLTAGDYYVVISASGYKAIPSKNVRPIPFAIESAETTLQTFYMETLAGEYGTIDGTISPAVADFLIVANSTTTDEEYSTYSGPDGYFVLFNIPFDSYIIRAIKAGYQPADNPDVTLSTSSPYATVTVNVGEIVGSTLNGKVTFLAIANGIVDVSLLDEESSSAINGLTTKIDETTNYSISKIPSGNYLAWASYENDGFVMDPDWIHKNPGVLSQSFAGDTTITLDFSVTGAISVLSPTNLSESVVPDTVDTVTPTFSWVAYSATKEYIVEVRDENGNLVWGGFTETGIIGHSQITKDNTSIEFNFDGSALAQLERGNLYQWKVYSDNDTDGGVQTLLSSSEDLMGLFYVK